MVTIISILAVISGILIGVIFSNIRNLDKISKLVKRIETLEKLSIVTDDTAHSASEAVSSIYQLETAHWNWTRKWVNYILTSVDLTSETWQEQEKTVDETAEITPFTIKENIK